jgi:hypothetical protein
MICLFIYYILFMPLFLLFSTRAVQAAAAVTAEALTGPNNQALATRPDDKWYSGYMADRVTFDQGGRDAWMLDYATSLVRSGGEKSLSVAAVGPGAKSMFDFVHKANEEPTRGFVPPSVRHRLPYVRHPNIATATAVPALSPQEAEIKELKALLARSEALRESQKLGYLAALAAVRTLSSELVLSFIALQERYVRSRGDRNRNMVLSRAGLKRANKASLKDASSKMCGIVQDGIADALADCRGGSSDYVISGPLTAAGDLCGGVELTHLIFSPAYHDASGSLKKHDAVALVEPSMYLSTLSSGVISPPAVAATTLNMYDVETRSSLLMSRKACHGSGVDDQHISKLQACHIAELLPLLDPDKGIIADVHSHALGVHSRWARGDQPLLVLPLASRRVFYHECLIIIYIYII